MAGRYCTVCWLKYVWFRTMVMLYEPDDTGLRTDIIAMLVSCIVRVSLRY